MKRSYIYTRTGDEGTTALVGGQRVGKDDIRLEAYGTIDELNAFIGRLVTSSKMPADRAALLQFVQNKLFNIGAYLATDNSHDQHADNCPGLTPDDTERLETAIDAIDTHLPPLHNFVIPGGTRLAANFHICRTVCRRAERRIISLARQAYVDHEIIKFINRLSDLFFIMARASNVDAQVEEIFWDKDC